MTLFACCKRAFTWAASLDTSHPIALVEASASPGDTAITDEREGKVSRRGFNKFLSLGTLAAAVGAVGASSDGCSKTFPAMVIAQAGDIPVGGSKIFTYPTEIHPCILLRPAETSYLAYSRICTHTSCPVFYRPELNRIICPCHGGAYSVADGSVIAGPPPRPLPRIMIEQRGNDLVATGVIKL